MGTLHTTAPAVTPKKRDYLKGAYAWLLVFSFVYFARPEDFIPMGPIPIAKVTGFLAIASFGLVVMAHPEVLNVAPEMKYLVALVLWFFIGVPFSPLWRGGAFHHATEFAKVVPIALLIGIVANNVRRLKRLIFVETAATVVCTIVALFMAHFHADENHRLTGALNGIYGNPNDLALCIVLVFPFCAMFMLITKNIFKKIVWCGAMVLMGFALLLTYSRAGVLALVVSGCVLMWEFGVKGRRHSLLIMGGFIALCVLVVAGPKGYFKRVGSVIDPNLDPGNASGSWRARKELLMLSVKTTLTHPIFGVGCGDFLILADWHVTHNSYTQTSAEGGILALVLYVLIIRRTFLNLRAIEVAARGDPELMVIAGMLKVSYAGFLVGSFFDSVAYNYFPYFLVAYTGSLLIIARGRATPAMQLEADKILSGKKERKVKVRQRKQAALSGAAPRFHAENGVNPRS